MAINKKLIHFNEKTEFEKRLANGEILDTSIVFVKDSKEIWTHGNYFAGESIDPELLEQIQTSVQELKTNVNDNPFEKGDAENSAVLKGGNNQAISEGSVALGKDNIVGLKGWYYSSIYKENDNTISVYLSNEQKAFNTDEDFKTESQTADESLPNLVETLGVNAVISLVNAGKYDDKFIVIGGSNGVVRLQTIDESVLPFDIITGQSVINYEDYSIYCLSKPDAGIAELGKYSFAVGYNNKVTNGESTAFGHNNHAYGKFSFVEGKDNKAGYASHAEGHSNIASGSISHAEGRNNVASGYLSHAEGGNNTAKAARSHAEGYSTKANGINSHAEGENSQANGKRAHAEGYNTKATGSDSHAEGFSTKALGNNSHAEGYTTKAEGTCSHAEGYCTTAIGESSHAEGSSDNIAATIEESDTEDGFAGLINKWFNTKFSLAYGHSAHIEGRNNLALGDSSHAEGFSTKALGESSHAEGNDTTATGYFSHAEGDYTTAEGTNSHAEGSSTKANGIDSHAEGEFSQANGKASHAEGFSTEALGESSHAEGNDTKAEGINSHAEGNKSYSLGNHSHAEGSDTKTEGVSSHAEGYKSQALGNNSHAEGNGTKAEGINSHSEGYNTHALGPHSHAEGNETKTEGSCAHAEGYKTQALGKYSHAEGNNTISKNEAEHACGKYNLSNSDTRFSIGIGTSEDDRKNAFEVKQNGDIYIEGVEGRIQDKLDKLVEITYSELKSLRDNSQLIPGQQYRITDYVTTTTQENTQSAGHQFDVIVTADDEKTLNEVARACLHEGDTYFSEHGAKLEAWQIWYSLDNDTERFAWALSNDKSQVICHSDDPDFPAELDGSIITPNVLDEELYIEGSKVLYTYTLTDSTDVMFASDWSIYAENERQIGVYNLVSGKGVIYRMIDEWGNDCPYDFKNILFKRFAVTAYDKVPSLVVDNGVNHCGYYYGALNLSGDQAIPKATYGEDFVWVYTFALKDLATETWHDYTILNSIGLKTDESVIITCHSNVIKEHRDEYLGEYGRKAIWLNNIVFFNCYADISSPDYSDYYSNCYSNSFGDNCFSNSFGNGCTFNSFGNYCYFNSFGNDCFSNSFGNDCAYNSFGNGCAYNSFGNGCTFNSFGNGCAYNSFGNGCTFNSFGNNCSYNSFGNACNINTFGEGCNSNTFENDCYNNTFGNDCRCNSFGNACYDNSFGNYCSNNSFENSCMYNSFRTSALAGSLKNYCYYNHFDDGCSYNVIWYSNTTSSSVLLKNINVNRGVSGTSSKYNFINIDTINSEKEININNYNGHIYVDYGDIFKVTYAELWNLRENSQLIPGRQYRIIDYNTTTSQENTTSAGHPFDIIVTAIDNEILSEEAQAAQNHINDNGYFNDSNLSAWKIWYSLDNDTDRFEWADDERIETTTVETIVADSSECTIKSELIDGNTFITPFNFESCVWVDANGDGETYADEINHDINELIYEWDYFTDENDNTHLCIYKSDAGLYEEEGQPDYGDKYLYRGVVNVDGTDYDYWQKWDANGDGLDVQGSGDYVFATTPRIVSNPEAYSSETTTETIETVIPLEPKGVIYRMIDEFGNDCPYDFKNIKFKHDGLGTDVYTFTWIDEDYNVMDTSVFGNNGTLTYYGEIKGVYGNVIKPIEMIYDEDSDDYLGTKQLLNNITFISDYEYETAGNYGFYGCYNNSFGYDCYNNTFGNNCYNNTFGNGCYNNSFGNGCENNSFGDNCYYNSFGNRCEDNSFGDNCYYNSFCNDCYYNTFGNGCHNNSFGEYCCFNSFGNVCYYNTFGNVCHNNSFGNKCNRNSFGDVCENNSFGAGCRYNSFGSSASTTSSLKNYCRYNHFDNGCSHNVIWTSNTTSSSVLLQNININRGISGKLSNPNFINIDTLNADYEIQVAKNSKGEIKIYCEADLIA